MFSHWNLNYEHFADKTFKEIIFSLCKNYGFYYNSHIILQQMNSRNNLKYVHIYYVSNTNFKAILLSNHKNYLIEKEGRDYALEKKLWLTNKISPLKKEKKSFLSLLLQ